MLLLAQRCLACVTDRREPGVVRARLRQLLRWALAGVPRRVIAVALGARQRCWREHTALEQLFGGRDLCCVEVACPATPDAAGMSSFLT